MILGRNLGTNISYAGSQSVKKTMQKLSAKHSKRGAP